MVGDTIGLDPCCCGAPKYDHSGAQSTGGCPDTGCRKYRRDAADMLAARALEVEAAPHMAAVAAWHDRTSPRPAVAEGGWSVGPSDAGACRKQIQYRERPPEGFVPDEVDDLAALMGSIIHDATARARGALYPWLQHERPVAIRGLDRTGKLDEWNAVLGIVADVKTAGRWMWEWVQANGPRPEHWEQVYIYGLGMTEDGEDVASLQLIYVDRETGKEQKFTRPWDEKFARYALGKLLAINVALDAGVDLPRDRSGPSSDPICAHHCFAVSDCWMVKEAEAAGRSPESYTILGPDPEMEAIEWAAANVWSLNHDKKAAGEEHAAAKPLLEGVVEPGEHGWVTFGKWKIKNRRRGMPDYKGWAVLVQAALERWRAAPPAFRGDFADHVAKIKIPTRIDTWVEVKPVSPPAGPPHPTDETSTKEDAT